MSVMKVKDYEIYYETHGTGIPLLFLEGLGYSVWMWDEQIPDISKWARCVLVDNRGVGKSTALKAPYSVKEFAEDSLKVMEALGISRFFVLGVSMGGFIAQELAHMAKDRVEGLILISTSCGGPLSLPMSKDTWDEMNKVVPGETAEEKIARTMRLALTDNFPRDRKVEFDAVVKKRGSSLPGQDQVVYQALATRDFDACDRNRELTMPSLLMCGTDDRVLPWTNSLILFKVLSNSSLLIFRDQNHLLFIEEADRVNGEVSSFIKEVESGTYRTSIREVE